jgi:hypothetical protein
MGRFETEWLATDANLEALTDLSGAWIDWERDRKPPDSIILDTDSSKSPTYGEQEGSCSNSLAIWTAVAYGRDLGAVKFELDPRSKVGLSGSSLASTKFGNENSDAESQTFVQAEPLDHLIVLGR